LKKFLNMFWVTFTIVTVLKKELRET
jgi:hypothetical protein